MPQVTLQRPHLSNSVGRAWVSGTNAPSNFVTVSITVQLLTWGQLTRFHTQLQTLTLIDSSLCSVGTARGLASSGSHAPPPPPLAGRLLFLFSAAGRFGPRSGGCVFEWNGK